MSDAEKEKYNDTNIKNCRKETYPQEGSEPDCTSVPYCLSITYEGGYKSCVPESECIPSYYYKKISDTECQDTYDAADDYSYHEDEAHSHDYEYMTYSDMDIYEMQQNGQEVIEKGEEDKVVSKCEIDTEAIEEQFEEDIDLKNEIGDDYEVYEKMAEIAASSCNEEEASKDVVEEFGSKEIKNKTTDIWAIIKSEIDKDFARFEEPGEEEEEAEEGAELFEEDTEEESEDEEESIPDLDTVARDLYYTFIEKWKSSKIYKQLATDAKRVNYLNLFQKALYKALRQHKKEFKAKTIEDLARASLTIVFEENKDNKVVGLTSEVSISEYVSEGIGNFMREFPEPKLIQDLSASIEDFLSKKLPESVDDFVKQVKDFIQENNLVTVAKQALDVLEKELAGESKGDFSKLVCGKEKKKFSDIFSVTKEQLRDRDDKFPYKSYIEPHFYPESCNNADDTVKTRSDFKELIECYVAGDIAACEQYVSEPEICLSDVIEKAESLGCSSQ